MMRLWWQAQQHIVVAYLSFQRKAIAPSLLNNAFPGCKSKCLPLLELWKRPYFFFVTNSSTTLAPCLLLVKKYQGTPAPGIQGSRDEIRESDTKTVKGTKRFISYVIFQTKILHMLLKEVERPVCLAEEARKCREKGAGCPCWFSNITAWGWTVLTSFN